MLSLDANVLFFRGFNSSCHWSLNIRPENIRKTEILRYLQVGIERDK